jgi:enoyl-CoA hydratase/carnithine racemase
MAKKTTFADYKDAYENFRFDLSDDGILLVQAHTNGGSLVWNADVHDRMADVFQDVAGDRDIRCVIHTGTGPNYNADWGFLAKGSVEQDGNQPPPVEQGWAPPVGFFAELGWYGKQMVQNWLDIDVPVISAVNGPCNMHSEIPLMSDVVLCSDDTWFDDGPHFARGMVPGDGQHIIWQMLLGPVRARYFLLTNHRITAEKALEWGVVNEVLPKDSLLDRAYEIAREIVKRPPMALHYTRALFTQELKRACLDELSHGIGLEILAQRQFYPVGGGMDAMKHSWTEPTPMVD